MATTTGSILVSGVPTHRSADASLLDHSVPKLVDRARRHLADVGSITLGGAAATTDDGREQARRAAQLLQDTSLILQAILYRTAYANADGAVRGELMQQAAGLAGASTAVAMFAAASSEPIVLSTFLRDSIAGSNAVLARVTGIA